MSSGWLAQSKSISTADCRLPTVDLMINSAASLFIESGGHQSGARTKTRLRPTREKPYEDTSDSVAERTEASPSGGADYLIGLGANRAARRTAATDRPTDSLVRSLEGRDPTKGDNNNLAAAAAARSPAQCVRV